MGIQGSENLDFDLRQIDDQRKAQLLIINHFLDACKLGKNAGDMKTLMKQLENQMDIHFKAEEKLFKKYTYPDYLSHREQHRKFKKDLNDLKKALKKEGSTIRFSMLASHIVSDWLFNHVSKVDKKFGKFLKKK